MATTVNPSPYNVPMDRDTFELPGGSPGVLLVHGFTGDTSEMRPLGERLNKLGLYCYAPLLPGHGVPPDRLHGITDEHWIAAARAGFEKVAAQHEKVIVCAFSMGAALTTIMLGNLPPQLQKRVVAYVAIAPMIATRIPILPILPLVSRVMPWFYPLKVMPVNMLGIRKKIQQYDPTLDLDDPAVIARLKNEVRVPVAVAEELRKIAQQAIQGAHRIHVPTLVMQGESDLTLDPEGARRFYRSISAKDRSLLTLAGADHDFVYPNRPGHALLLSTVEGWVKQRFLPRI